MEKRIFGKTGLKVSALGFGAAPIGFLQTEQARIEKVLHSLLDAGVNFIDTAASYEGSELSLSPIVKARRSEMVLVSKCGQCFSDVPGEAWSREVISGTVERSLHRLKTDHLDVMLLHSCDLDTLKKGEALDALVSAQKAGKIRFVGYSGDNEAAVYATGLPQISVIETSINICDQANIDTVLPVTRKQNVGVIAKRPIANTAWRPLKQLPGMYQEYAKTYRDRFEAMGLNARDLGFKGDQDWPEIAVRFTLEQPGVHVAIIGTTNPENARRNIDAAAKGPLPREATAKLREAFNKARGGQDWPGQT